MLSFSHTLSLSSLSNTQKHTRQHTHNHTPTKLTLVGVITGVFLFGFGRCGRFGFNVDRGVGSGVGVGRGRGVRGRSFGEWGATNSAGDIGEGLTNR